VKEWETTVGSATAVAGEILAFRRTAFSIPDRYTLTEDFFQAMLAAIDGWRIAYVPEAVSYEHASATVADEALRRTRIVTGRWQALAMLLPRLFVSRPPFALQVVSHKGLRPLVPFMLVTAAISNVFARRRWARWLGLGQIAFYGLALLGSRSETRKGRKLVFLPYYFCRMNIATLRGALQATRVGDRTYWTKVKRG